MKPALFVFFIAALVGGCSCNRKKKEVPFGLSPEIPSHSEKVASPPPEPFEEVSGRIYATGTQEVSLRGATLESPGLQIFAALPYGRDDATQLLIIARPETASLDATIEGELGLYVSQKKETMFTPPALLREAQVERAACVPIAFDLRQFAPYLAAAEVEFECPETMHMTEVAIVDTTEQPRSVTHFTLTGRSSGAPAPSATFQVEATEQTRQLLMELSNNEQLTARLMWKMTHGRLARDDGEPSNTLRTALEDVREMWSETQYREALNKGLASLDLYDALCAEGGYAQVWSDGRWGVKCRAEDTEARITALSLAAAMRAGRMEDALPLALRLWPDGAETDAQPDGVAKAVMKKSSEAIGYQQLELKSGPSGGKAASQGPMLRFVDDEHVFVDSKDTLVALKDKAQSLAPHLAPSSPVKHPNQPFAVRPIKQDCFGHILPVVKLSSTSAAGAVGTLSKELRVESRHAPARSSCAHFAKWQGGGSGGWQVLGWGESGILLAKGLTMKLVPLTGPPRSVDVKEDLSIRAPKVSQDGKRYVVTVPQGVFVVDQKRASKVRYYATPGRAAGDHVVISPGGHRIAFLKHGSLFWADIA